MKDLQPAANTQTSHTEERPWPVILLTALGAWLVAIPLLLLLGLLFREVLETAPGLYSMAALLLGFGTLALRQRGLPIFVEQLAIPLIPAGLAMFALGMASSDHAWGPTAQILLALAMLVLALAIPRLWLRALLGASACGMIVTLSLTDGFFRWSGDWAACHGALVIWLAALCGQHRLPSRIAAMLESIAGGWLVAVLVSLALFSGSTFLLSGALGFGAFNGMQQEATTATAALLHRGGSMLLAIAGALYAGYQWSSLRRPLCACVAAVLVGLCAWLPLLGGTLLALSVVGTSGRWRQAGLAAFVATWIVGTFYYQLEWSLMLKGSILIAGACALAATCWLSGTKLRGVAITRGLPNLAENRRPVSLLLGFGALLILAVANIGIWQKESLIADGRPVFIALEPVDPRSLIQGDYMSLNFLQLQNITGDIYDFDKLNPTYLVMRRDPRGLATPLRAYQSGVSNHENAVITDTPVQRPARQSVEHLAADEFLIELTPRKGRWALVTDAWYFAEGEAGRWETAKYGDFRVLPNGKALLVGLADANFRPLGY